MYIHPSTVEAAHTCIVSPESFQYRKCSRNVPLEWPVRLECLLLPQHNTPEGGREGGRDGRRGKEGEEHTYTTCITILTLATQKVRLLANFVEWSNQQASHCPGSEGLVLL